ncbi:MAG: thioredoxin [Bacteroidia bacterium]
MAKPVVVTDESFQKEVLENPTLTIVDFWAPWCGPCHMIAPILEQLAQEYEGRLRIAKVNVDENPQTPYTYGVMAIPTLVFFRGGKVVDKQVGALPKPALKARIDKLLT